MRMQQRLAVSVLAALAALTSGAAQADVSAFAGVLNFGYRLIDLNPDDGIAPGIELLPFAATTSGSSRAASRYIYLNRPLFGGTDLQGEDYAVDDTQMFSPMLSTQIDGPGLHADTRIAGSLAERSLSYSASGFLHYDAPTADDRRGSGFSAVSVPAAALSGSGATAFRLTPFTQVVWSGDMLLQVEGSVGRSGDTSESVYAFFNASVRNADFESLGDFSQALSMVLNAPGRDQLSMAMSLSFSNAGAGSAIGYFDTTAVVEGNLQQFSSTGIPPVPEPGTAALMLCGLGLVAGTALARRHRAACWASRGTRRPIVSSFSGKTVRYRPIFCCATSR